LLDEESILVAEDGRFLIGFGRDSEGPHRLTVHLPDDSIWTQELRPAARSFDIQRIDGLPSEKVTPRPEVLERIREEAALARQARTRRDARIDWDAGFIRPVTGRVTGVYGSQRILNGQPRAAHWGLDIAAPTGTPVQSPAGGIVTLVHSDMYFSGGTLFIDHGHGLVSAFLHLSDILVEPGQRVAQGEIIAEVGATGRATGPHLDWRISLGDVRIDPALLLADGDE
jgi:murein DD-endopeptidase MepM/ murein hydrolase activator NlpD